VDSLWFDTESVGESAIYRDSRKAVDGSGSAPPGVDAGIYDSCLLRAARPPV